MVILQSRALVLVINMNRDNIFYDLHVIRSVYIYIRAISNTTVYTSYTVLFDPHT